MKNQQNPLWRVDAFQQQMESLADGWEEISTALTGRTLGRYQIQDKIGAGGMGVVYRAQDTRLGRTVALKVLLPGLTADPERRSRFVREAKAASALNHPNIITVHDIDQADGIDFIAMEFIAGRTLQDIIACREADDLGCFAICVADRAGAYGRPLRRNHSQGYQTGKHYDRPSSRWGFPGKDNGFRSRQIS